MRFVIKTSFWNSGYMNDWCWVTFGDQDLNKNPEHYWTVEEHYNMNGSLDKIWKFSKEEDSIFFSLVWL